MQQVYAIEKRAAISLRNNVLFLLVNCKKYEKRKAILSSFLLVEVLANETQFFIIKIIVAFARGVRN